MIVCEQSPEKGEWIRLAGERHRKGGVVLPAGKRLLPQDIGLAASVGIKAPAGVPQAALGLFFTGDELVMPGDAACAPGQIYNSNRFTLGARGCLGCEVRDHGIVQTRWRHDAALDCARRRTDLIVTSGGVSVGDEDHVKPAVEAEGSLLADMKIADETRPALPLAFGSIGNSFSSDRRAIPFQASSPFRHLGRCFRRDPGQAEVAPLPSRATDFDWPVAYARR